MYLFLGYIKEVLIQEKYFSSKLNLLKQWNRILRFGEYVVV